jgi:hypothetical protein
MLQSAENISTETGLCFTYLQRTTAHSVQNLLSPRLLSEDVKIRIYKTIILLVVLYGCET